MLMCWEEEEGEEEEETEEANGQEMGRRDHNDDVVAPAEHLRSSLSTTQSIQKQS